MATYHFAEARCCVLDRVRQARPAPSAEVVSLLDADGRVLAEEVRADRDYPPLARSVRDGYAVRAADLPGELEVIGEVRAGESANTAVGPGQAIEIMTGAPIPPGADAVIMIEHTTLEGPRVRCDRAAKPGDFINPQGAESRSGETLIAPGVPLNFTHIALAATVGHDSLRVFAKPRVAILATGDEIVEVHEQPLAYQIRNSNAQSLAAQVRRAGGVPEILPVARDNYESTLSLIERGLRYGLLLLSGGVSAGKYDIVERVLADLGAGFFFDRVLIQPGQPLVFGRARGTFFFGLPGNPASTMVTFEIFARAAVELLGGLAEPRLPMLESRLARDFRHKTGLTRFLPARLSPDGREVTPVPWRGSSDVPAMARGNAFLVADADRESWNAGDPIRALVI